MIVSHAKVVGKDHGKNHQGFNIEGKKVLTARLLACSYINTIMLLFDEFNKHLSKVKNRVLFGDLKCVSIEFAIQNLRLIFFAHQKSLKPLLKTG